MSRSRSVGSLRDDVDGLSAAELVRELVKQGARIVDGQGDAMTIVGCPACGRGGWVVDAATVKAAATYVRGEIDLRAPCSGACRAQLAVLAEREEDLLEVSAVGVRVDALTGRPEASDA